jgi:hypothetical protein
MALNTPRLTLPYPVPGDTVDVPRDVLALATRLDALLVPVVNTLPASPSDGDEVYYNVPGIPGARWHLKWEATSAKWWCLGGYTYAVADASTETRGPGGATHPTFIALGTGSQIAVPLPGLYDITVQAMFWNVTPANNTVRIRPFLNDMGTGLSSMDTAQTLTNLSEWHQWFQVTRATVPAAGNVVLGYSQSLNGQLRFERKQISIAPIYVTP